VSSPPTVAVSGSVRNKLYAKKIERDSEPCLGGLLLMMVLGRWFTDGYGDMVEKEDDGTKVNSLSLLLLFWTANRTKFFQKKRSSCTRQSLSRQWPRAVAGAQLRPPL